MKGEEEKDGLLDSWLAGTPRCGLMQTVYLGSSTTRVF